jgi:membrane-associated phospholipid phosphatase
MPLCTRSSARSFASRPNVVDRRRSAQWLHSVQGDLEPKTALVKRSIETVALACLLAGSKAFAQTAQSAEPEVHKTFYRAHDGLVATEFLAASAGLSVFDARIAHFFQDTTRIHVRAGRRVDNVFTHINETTLTVGGLALYGIARLAGADAVAATSFHVASAVFAASVTSQVIRGPLGRTRPRDADRPFENQYDFHFMRGFGHFQQRAFPSIHSSSGFAAASAIVAEVKQRNPGATWIVGVPAYALALTPGLSRMYLGQHWASDIFAGAFMGTFYGWRVVNYAHSNPTTPVDRLFLGRSERDRIAAADHAVRFGWTVTF